MTENRHTPRREHGNEGIALIFVLGYLAVVTLLAATFLTTLNRNISRATASQAHQVCVNIAEGGVEQAIAALREGGAADQVGTLGQGHFTATVRGVNGAFEIVSTATLTDSPDVRTRIVASVSREASGGVRVVSWNEVTKW
ncbi:MAG: hypothetical protein K1Y02_02410 [Candidatus Hydrogenedentes bacterium]|nr:hypothetical protein [Candidatus Hydrogenedentota bacterium]